MQRRDSSLLAVLVLWLGLGSTTHAQLTIVAKTGDPAPGLDATFWDFSRPLINNLGETGFSGASLEHPEYDGVYIASGGNIQLTAKSGDPAPGSPTGATFSSVSIGGLSDTGQMMVIGGLGTSTFYGFWVGAANQPLTYVAEKYAAAEGFEVARYFDIETPRLAGGNIILAGTVAGGPPEPDNGALWGGSVDGFHLIRRQSPPPPGGIDLYNASLPVINAAGQIAFKASVYGMDSFHATELWYGTTGSQQLVLQVGDVAPQIPNKTVQGIYPPSINRNGQIVFIADLGRLLEGEDDPPVRDQAIYTGTPGNLQLRARSGQAAPGMPEGVVFSAETISGNRLDSFDIVQQNGRGDVAFLGFVSGPGIDMTNNDGLWLARAGQALKLLVREGDAAPGAPSGSRFVADNRDLDQYNPAFFGPSLNNRGQIIFASMYEDGLGQNTLGVWATDLDDALHLIVYEGEQIDLGGGVIKTMGRFDSVYNYFGIGSASEDGQNFVFNDAGQFVFTAHFTDGTSAVMIAQVPEAGSGFVMVLLAICAARRRHGKTS